mmetsp:Transcript_7679/g.18734  ORF Transcript_7679/g.18734 Transcript_7679/m.18734 type:complete len:227 (-) Transcript_7679:76-756(-)
MLEGTLWKTCPISTEITVITPSANMEPLNARKREALIASRAAMKNVLSPISEARTREEACRNPPESRLFTPIPAWRTSPAASAGAAWTAATTAAAAAVTSAVLVLLACCSFVARFSASGAPGAGSSGSSRADDDDGDSDDGGGRSVSGLSARTISLPPSSLNDLSTSLCLGLAAKGLGTALSEPVFATAEAVPASAAISIPATAAAIATVRPDAVMVTPPLLPLPV